MEEGEDEEGGDGYLTRVKSGQALFGSIRFL